MIFDDNRIPAEDSHEISGSDQTACMSRLVSAFAGPSYHIVGNLMLRLILFFSSYNYTKQ